MLQSLLAQGLLFRSMLQPFFFSCLLFLMPTFLPPLLASFSLLGGFSLLGAADRPSLAVPHNHTARPLRHLLHGKLPVTFQIALRRYGPLLVPVWRSRTGGHRERIALEATTCLGGENPAVNLVPVVRRHLQSLGRRLGRPAGVGSYHRRPRRRWGSGWREFFRCKESSPGDR